MSKKIIITQEAYDANPFFEENGISVGDTIKICNSDNEQAETRGFPPASGPGGGSPGGTLGGKP